MALDRFPIEGGGILAADVEVVTVNQDGEAVVTGSATVRLDAP